MAATVIELGNGLRLCLRPIQASDRELLVEGLAALSPRSARLRFLAAKPRLSARELDYLTAVDGRDHIALVAVTPAPPPLLYGVARCVRLPDQPRAAEVAVVVRDDAQGLGLGAALLRALRNAAVAVGIERFVATVFGDNLAVQRLLARVARSVESAPLEHGLRLLQAKLV